MASNKRTQAALAGMAALLMVAAAVTALAGGGGSARALVNCDVGDYSNDGEELAFLGLINDYRAQNGLGPLTISTNLNRASHWMSNDMGTNAYFGHTDSLGRSAYQRALDCGYPQGAGENLAAGTNWDTAQEAFTAWQNSSGHNSNMLGAFYQQIGIARINVPGSPYGWYWTTNFGATDDGTGGGGGDPTPTNTATNTPVPPTATNTPVAPTTTNTPGGETTNTPPAPTATPTNTPPGAVPSATPSPTPSPTPTNAGGATGSGSPANTATPTRTPVATATPTTPAGSLPLVPGSANLVGWPGADEDPDAALKSLASTIEMVYRWDPVEKQWERYGPTLPWYVNNLLKLRNGEAYWVITK